MLNIFKRMLAVLVFVLSTSTLANVTETSMKDISLKIELTNSPIKRSDRTIDFDIILCNTSNSDLQYSIREGKDPFNILLWDKSGNILNRVHDKSISKNRSQIGKKVILAAMSSIKYKANIDIANILNRHNLDVAEINTLKLEVNYPIVQYFDEQYQVHLIKSKKINLEFLEGEVNKSKDSTNENQEEKNLRIVNQYIEMFYNRKRRHSHLGHKSPAQFERESVS